MPVLRLLFFLFPLCLFAQKKPLEIADVHRWRKIEQPRITSGGQWVAYLLAPVTEGDNRLCLWNAATGQTTAFERGAEPKFSADDRYLVFKIKPPLDTLKAQRRRKVKEEDLPKDSLAIFDLTGSTLQKFPKVKSFAVPEKWAGWLAYQLEPEKPAAPKKDTTAAKNGATAPKAKEPKPKKEDAKENGSRLILRELASGREDTLPFVREFSFAKRGPALVLYSTGRDSTFLPGVYRFDCRAGRLHPLFRAGKAKFAQTALDDWGRQAVFLADTDTSKARIRPWQLGYWSEKQDSAQVLATAASAFLPRAAGNGSGWTISENTRPQFSEDGSKLYFGMAPPPVLNDTTLLPEEIVNVEVWAWHSNRQYTELEKRMEADKKRAYPVVRHLQEKKFVPLGSPDLPEWRFQEQRDADLALAYSEEPYAQNIQWEGAAYKDLYAVDLKTGTARPVARGLRCKPRLSPAAKYIAWWSEPDSAWFAWSARNSFTARLTSNLPVKFFNEENDLPDYPEEYGLAGWFHNDAALLIYDRYDLWETDPEGKKQVKRLTHGRETKTRYRYIRLDPEERSIAPDARLLLHWFDEDSRAEGYAWLDLKTGSWNRWEPASADGQVFSYHKNPIKAEKSDALLFTRQNYQTFPDLWYVEIPGAGNRLLAPARRFSDANPQQAAYQWGSIELVRWTSLSGETLEGLLIKPEDFDPNKKYPLIVNFYEKLSDGLNQHRAPDVHRSSITYTMYASRGYLVFAPDIPYRTGYPGESAYNAIMSGVTMLLQRGCVDPARIGLQGHSWGGYQAAYLVTRTNMFRCAEAGAPVANMTSAYGGIRWESGLSRQFQYERQQSRIGGTLWAYPMRYLENSPLFSLDKVQTPLLILHNDNDGAVPWQQGGELFSGLRRLGKPAWLLNYNDEPHWPLKLQNRIDFQTRMQQFFDHYLMGAPRPRWMERGVPPLEKGILQGLEPTAGH